MAYFFLSEETKVQISVFWERRGDNHFRKASKIADMNMKNKTPVSLYELIVKGLKEAIENEKNKGKEIGKRDNQVNFDKQ